MKTLQSKYKIFSWFLVAVIIVCLFVIGKDFYATAGSENEIKKIHKLVEDEGERGFSRDTFNELKSLNSDFVGYIEFDSGLLSLPILQTDNNDYYLHHTFYKNYYYLHGHPFMNYASTINDQNIIIYGHNNRTSENKMFSPLNSLFEQKTYEQNAYFKIYFDDSVRSYVITHIYILNDEEYYNYDFEVPFISADDWNEWISYANKKNSIIPINGGLEQVNNFVTLQTCAIGNEKIVVVLAREISRDSY